MMEAIHDGRAELFPLGTSPFRDTLYAGSPGNRLRVSTCEGIRFPSSRSGYSETFDPISSSESSGLYESIRHSSKYERHSNYRVSPKIPKQNSLTFPGFPDKLILISRFFRRQKMFILK